jgi:hypothetical protein
MLRAIHPDKSRTGCPASSCTFCIELMRYDFCSTNYGCNNSPVIPSDPAKGEVSKNKL